jgi:hypothetical protein
MNGEFWVTGKPSSRKPIGSKQCSATKKLNSQANSGIAMEKRNKQQNQRNAKTESNLED